MLSLRICSTRSLVVVMLSGWREQGVQVVDLKTRKVTQKLLQDGAFYGAAFSPDGHRLCVSGSNTDMLFIYAWKDGVASLENKFELSKAKTVDGTGTSHPAGLAFSPNGSARMTTLPFASMKPHLSPTSTLASVPTS
jgi:DNA-binding beta-propeller fold protein YncE